MLVNLASVLRQADQYRYAVGGFNVTTLETALAIVEAAEETDSPVILQISEKTIDFMGLDVAFAIAKTLADRSSVPIVVHLDHGRNLDLAHQALKIGFSSVMLDVSHLPIERRIPVAQEFTEAAHRLGASVELEEDKIAGREDYLEEGRGYFTDPKRASVFTRVTGCDAFAVSIGSAHGQPLPYEKLDLALLAEIDRAVEVPLVLHGASATPEKTIRQAISLGICKINIDTDLRLAFTKQLRQTLQDESLYDPREELKPSREEVKRVAREKIKLFGSADKA